MREKIDLFLPCEYIDDAQNALSVLHEYKTVQHIHFLVSADFAAHHQVPEGCTFVITDRLESSNTIVSIVENTDADYVMICTRHTTIGWGNNTLERFLRVADDTDAVMVYADHYKMVEGKMEKHPVIDYQSGSLRDDFDFGSLWCIKAQALADYIAQPDREEYQFAALYDLRLYLSRVGEIFHLNEFLYSEAELDTRKSGEKQFDYVNPRNREVQIEMEKACTQHLGKVGALIDTTFYRQPDFGEQDFEYEASVIIPVRNRIRTIRDAIHSVLKQKTDFKFNLIIIDNHSTDGTTEAIDEFKNDERLIHIIPERKDLGIGGCWNMGVHHPKCGKFAVQLDSDDVYSDENTLTTMVRAFYEQNCAMVVGTYMMTDFNMNMIAPGIIDHKEWTPENGRNNALRINGLGAPRAFYTPVLREVKVPNTSYGEDYALGLNFSRQYQIGRVYDVVYMCRRWDDNSDASLDIVKMNGHNLYKDRIRTWELQARVAMNKQG